jgi:hypothetical protein
MCVCIMYVCMLVEEKKLFPDGTLKVCVHMCTCAFACGCMGMDYLFLDGTLKVCVHVCVCVCICMWVYGKELLVS